MESVVVRIGSVLPEGPDERMLSAWISPDDFVSLKENCRDADPVGDTMIWGASDNSRGFWRADDRAAIEWAPRDSFDSQAERVRGRVTTDPVAERDQGGRFVSVDDTRDGFAPPAMFPKEL